jgi:hypothetical protein
MRSSPRWTIPILLAWAAVAMPVASQVQADPGDAEAYGDDYRTGDYGRVRHVEGALTLLREEPGAESDGEVNSPVFPGDGVLTAGADRAEIELAGGVLVRIDGATELRFLALPDPYATVRDNTVLQLSAGTIRLTGSLDGEQEFRIDTPAASVYLLGDGDFRVDVDDRGRTRVESRRGVAEVVGRDGSVLVRSGMRTEVVVDDVPRDPIAFNTFASDSFDRWVERREAAYRPEPHTADADAYDSLPREVRPYYGELSRHGRWVWVGDYGHVWYPSGVSVDWRPYYAGSWYYGPRGYFWVSSEPWGWAPYHYGRWVWTAGGWCWAPGRVFSGAWVAWSWGPTYVGWSALDYWDRPAVVASVHFGHYDPHCWTFVRYDHFHHSHVHRHAVSSQVVGRELEHGALVTRPPRVSPRDLASSPDTRSRAYRTARDDRGAQVRPSSGSPSPAAGFATREARVRRPAVDARSAGPERPGQAGRGTVMRREGARTLSPSASAPAPGAAPFPRRTPPAGAGTTRQRVGASRPADGQRAAPQTPVERANPTPGPSRRDDVPSIHNRGSAQRTRIYQRMAAPRTTQDRTREAPSARTDRTPEGRPPERAGQAPPPRRAPSAARPRSETRSPDTEPPEAAPSGGGNDSRKADRAPSSSVRRRDAAPRRESAPAARAPARPVPSSGPSARPGARPATPRAPDRRADRGRQAKGRSGKKR